GGRDGSVFEHRTVASDHRERASQLVRGQVEELGLGPLELRHPVGVLAKASSVRLPLRVATLLGLMPLREVSRDLAESAQATRFVSECGDHHACPKPRAILAHAPALLLVATLALGDLELPLRLAVSDLFFRVEDREVPADDLVGGVALDPLGALVPRHDRARWVEHEDRVVHDTRDEERELIAEHPRLRRGRPPQHQLDLKDSGPAGAKVALATPDRTRDAADQLELFLLV